MLTSRRGTCDEHSAKRPCVECLYAEIKQLNWQVALHRAMIDGLARQLILTLERKKKHERKTSTTKHGARV